MTRLPTLAAASVLLFGAAACTTIVPPPPAAATAQVTELKASTPSYDLKLDLGGPQTMTSQADAQKQMPTSGEVLVSGTMTAMKQLPPGTAPYHLDLHVLHVFSDTPIKGASLAITITSPTLKAPIKLPIAVMYGAKQGAKDWHYGNNVALAPGDYTVKVVVNAEAASFKLTVPK